MKMRFANGTVFSEENQKSPTKAGETVPVRLILFLSCGKRHFTLLVVFKLRIDKAAHPQMREIATMLLCEFQKNYPIIFDDIQVC